ncbi:rhodanese-like domain-containing protein [Candidatus Pelagibacter bacterium]|jgi:rhodanese-related sulfurtransferase|nr:rhodanese-like domain-containing protein [Candidatus Pelagibacter bacterium]
MNIKSSQKLVEEAQKNIETLEAQEVKKLLNQKEITLIDVRDIRELWKEGTIKNSKHIPRGMLEFWLDPESSYYEANKIKDIKKMVLFCALGWRSALATKSLVDMGFKNVASVNGGYDALKKSGFKIVRKEKK